MQTSRVLLVPFGVSEVWWEEKTDRCGRMFGQVRKLRPSVCVCVRVCVCVQTKAKFSPSSSRVHSARQSLAHSRAYWMGDRSPNFSWRGSSKWSAKKADDQVNTKRQPIPYFTLPLHTCSLLPSPVHPKHELRFLQERGLTQETSRLLINKIVGAG